MEITKFNRHLMDAIEINSASLTAMRKFELQTLVSVATFIEESRGLGGAGIPDFDFAIEELRKEGIDI